MPSPSVAWSSAGPDGRDFHNNNPNNNLNSTAVNHGFSPTHPVPQETTFWDSLLEYPSWHPPGSMHIDSLQDGIQEPLSTPAPWNYQACGNKLPTTTAIFPSSPSCPARLNSAASALPSTPSSSMSCESSSDTSAEEDCSQRRHGVSSSSSARPSLQRPPGPNVRRRKTLDRVFDEREIESLDSKKPSDYKARRKGTKRAREPRYAIQTRSDMEIMEDGYKWRKYGQKTLKYSPHPRSYYRCTNPKCPVRKRVERSTSDTGVVITTYECTHTHASPSVGSRGASDAPLLPAAGEHPPGDAPYYYAPKFAPPPQPPPQLRISAMLAATAGSTRAGTLQPTPKVEPRDYFPASPRTPFSGASLRAQSDARPSPPENTIKPRTDHLMPDLMQDLQGAMRWGCVVPSHHSERAQEILHSLVPKAKLVPPSLSTSSSRDGLLEDIVRRHRH